MLEPKVFQVAIDYVAPIFTEVTLKTGKTDKVVALFVSLLERFSSGSFISLLLILAVIYLLITLVRSIFIFTAKAINASATEYATESLRNSLFAHIQRCRWIIFRVFQRVN